MICSFEERRYYELKLCMIIMMTILFMFYTNGKETWYVPIRKNIFFWLESLIRTRSSIFSVYNCIYVSFLSQVGEWSLLQRNFGGVPLAWERRSSDRINIRRSSLLASSLVKGNGVSAEPSLFLFYILKESNLVSETCARPCWTSCPPACPSTSPTIAW